MNLLLDSHILIWALTEDSRLTDKAKELILDEENQIFYSTASIWEISIKHALHPDHVSFSGRELSHYCQEAGFGCVAIRDKHIYALETLKRKEGVPKHNDAFDRILVAQAKSEKMRFMTHDGLIPYYEEDCILEV